MVIVVLLSKCIYSRVHTNVVKEIDIKTVPDAISGHANFKIFL